MREKIRKTILDFINSAKSHPASAEVFKYLDEKLGKHEKDIYRQELIKLIEENKITSELSINKEPRYEAEHRHHYHFICEQCGVVKDVFLGDGAMQMITDHAQRIVNSYAKIERANLSFQGVCHKCRQ